MDVSLANPAYYKGCRCARSLRTRKVPSRFKRVDNTLNWARYLRAITGTDTGARISQRTGIAESTISRWLSGSIPARVPRQVVTLAHEYEANAAEALVAAGYLDESDLVMAEPPRGLQLAHFTDMELAEEMVRRVAAGRSEVLEAPLDENHPAMRQLNDGE